MVSGAQPPALIHREAPWELFLIFLEYLFDDSHFFGTSGLSQAQEQDTSMGFS